MIANRFHNERSPIATPWGKGDRHAGMRNESRQGLAIAFHR